MAVLSTVRSYDREMMCGEPATTFGFSHPGYMHTAVIPSTDAGYSRQLHYRVGSPEVGWSQAFSFTAPFTFLVFNDVGQENSVLFNDTCPPYCPGGWAWVDYTANSTKLGQHLMREDEASLGLLVGDLSYANGVQADWDYFGHQFQAPFSRWPLMVATGNHERDQPHTGDVLNDASSDSGGECNVPYTYSLPTALNPYKSYYSFSMATVHFLMLDSESPSHKGSPQHSFVLQDLAKVDRSKHPWLVVGCHRMMAGPTTNPVNVQNMARLQADYEELFKQHAVDQVLQDPQAPVYVLAGHAGAGFTHAFPAVLPGWVAFGVQDQNGYVRVTVSGNKLTMASISTDDGHVIDAAAAMERAAQVVAGTFNR
ncbi:Metallo-dependent phosphatase-like protein [Scenedesmus sp. NREL 46B-D3]|nr:Metallo-dependent phosphatase-like protein [Scenedesmus sp. NREL 46B-D3]